MELYFLNARPAPDVLVQPEVELRHWRILQRGTGALHIAARLDSGSLRVTSALLVMDLPQRIVKTTSGRSYRLCAPPEEDELLRALLVMNALRDLGALADDVSEAIWDAVSSGAWPSEEASLPPRVQ